MGSEVGETHEQPVHRVTLSKPFLLGVHEVTQEQYWRVTGLNPSKFKGRTSPVEQVSWEDAVEFCRKLSALPEEKAAGRIYRLPTEAEWEYACRAGTTTEFNYGVDPKKLADYAWYGYNSGGTTHPVGQKKPNPWGLYDMHGNVFEWCQDWYSPYPSGAMIDPVVQDLKSGSSSRVSRGGSFLNRVAGYCRSAYRFTGPSALHGSRGFRVACDPSSQ